MYAMWNNTTSYPQTNNYQNPMTIPGASPSYFGGGGNFGLFGQPLGQPYQMPSNQQRYMPMGNSLQLALLGLQNQGVGGSAVYSQGGVGSAVAPWLQGQLPQQKPLAPSPVKPSPIYQQKPLATSPTKPTQVGSGLPTPVQQPFGNRSLNRF